MKRDRLSKLASMLRPHLGTTAPAIFIGGTGGGTGDPVDFADLIGELSPDQAPWVDDHIAAAIDAVFPHDILDPESHTVTGAQYSIIGLTATNELGLLQSTYAGAADFDTILRSGPAGQLSLALLVTGAISATDDLNIYPVGDLIMEPGGSVIAGTGVSVISEGYTPEGVAGWRLASTGGFDGISATANEVVARQSMFAANDSFRVIHHTHDYDHAHVVVNPGPFWNLDEQFGVDIDDNLLVRGYIVGKHAIQLPGAMMICHYDGPEPYETNFAGNPMGHMGQVGVEAGGVIYRLGKFGKGAQLARYATNRVSNPSFENGATGWVVDGTVGEQGVSGDRSFVGASSYKITKNSGSNSDNYGVYTQATTTIGETYTASVWVFVESLTGTSPQMGLSFQSHTVSQDIRDMVTVPANEWVRLRATLTADTSAVSLYVFFEAGYGTVYADAAQIEIGADVTPYLDGSMGQGHAWAGAPHNSWSARDNSSISYSIDGLLSPTAITAGCWVRRIRTGPGVMIAHPSVTLEFL